MPYVRFNGDSNKYYGTVMPFSTQHGKAAIRIVSSPIPVMETGFRFFDDNDKLITNYSAYRYHYEDNSYSIEKDEIVPAGPSNAPIPVSPIYTLERQVSAVTVQANETASQVETITPYTDSKKAYIDDTEVIFDCDKTGAISAWLISDGVRTECEYEVSEGKIRVFFEPLEVVSEVFIQIQ